MAYPVNGTITLTVRGDQVTGISSEFDRTPLTEEPTGVVLLANMLTRAVLPDPFAPNKINHEYLDARKVAEAIHALRFVPPAPTN